MQLLSLIYFVFTGLICSSNEEIHDLHLSMTEINWNDDSVELSTRIFSDDLLNALLQRFDLKTLPDKPEKTKSIIHQYISERLIFSQDGIPILIVLESIEPGQEAFWCTFSISAEGVDQQKPLEIKNEILFEIFDDQTNIVHLNYAGQKKVLTFDQKKGSIEIRL